MSAEDLGEALAHGGIGGGILRRPGRLIAATEEEACALRPEVVAAARVPDEGPPRIHLEPAGSAHEEVTANRVEGDRRGPGVRAEGGHTEAGGVEHHARGDPACAGGDPADAASLHVHAQDLHLPDDRGAGLPRLVEEGEQEGVDIDDATAATA